MPQTWAHVQSRAATGGGAGTTQALAFTTNVTAGSLIVVCAHTNNTARAISSIADSLGGSYGAAGATQTRASHGAGDIWFAKNSAAGANTVTVTFNGSLSGVSTYVCIAEYSGIDTTSPADGFAAANGSSTTPSSGNVTTTAADSLVVGFCYAGGTASASGGFTSRQTVNGDLFEDIDKAVAGTVAAVCTQAPTQVWIMMGAGFKQAAGGGGGVTVEKLTALGVG